MADYDPILDRIVERMKSPGWEVEARRDIASNPPTTNLFSTEYETWKYNTTYRLCMSEGDVEVTQDLSYNELVHTLNMLGCYAEVSSLCWRMWNDESINLDIYIRGFENERYSVEPVHPFEMGS